MTWLEIKNIIDAMTDDELKSEASVRYPDPNGNNPIRLYPIHGFDKIEYMEASPGEKVNSLDVFVFDTTGLKLEDLSKYTLYFDYPYGPVLDDDLFNLGT